MKEIHFNNNWLEKAVRDCLNIPSKALTQSDLDKITYLKIAEPYNYRCSLELSTNLPPIPFVDPKGGDEWECCCVGKENFLKSLQLSSLEIAEECGEYTFSKNDYENCSKFLMSTKQYNELGQNVGEKESSKVIPNIKEWYENPNNCLAEDLSLFKNATIVRIYGIGFNNLNFLNEFKNLKVLECSDSGSPDEDTLKELTQLQQLCVW